MIRSLLAAGLIAAALWALPAVAAAHGPARTQEIPKRVYGTVGLGTTNPFRPGGPGTAWELGAVGELGAWGFELTSHVEGNRALQLEGTSFVTTLGVTWQPLLLERPNQLVRVHAYTFLLLDLFPRTGFGLQGAYGWQGSHFSVAGFLDMHQPYYDEAGLIGSVTTGVEGRTYWRYGYAQVRLGTIGGAQPYALVTVGTGFAWGKRRYGVW